uniref:Temporin-1Tc n=2 Tax=Rana temporaria TaxID=8407 RepID=TPC_RANTE|nr:RecName: Full=Temporin-1Tc; Short=TC; AltName: Full=Temporin-C [Rana temporaria]
LLPILGNLLNGLL